MFLIITSHENWLQSDDFQLLNLNSTVSRAPSHLFAYQSVYYGMDSYFVHLNAYFNFYLYVYVCVLVRVCRVWMPVEVRRGCQTPGAGVRGICELIISPVPQIPFLMFYNIFTHEYILVLKIMD